MYLMNPTSSCSLHPRDVEPVAGETMHSLELTLWMWCRSFKHTYKPKWMWFNKENGKNPHQQGDPCNWEFIMAIASCSGRVIWDLLSLSVLTEPPNSTTLHLHGSHHTFGVNQLEPGATSAHVEPKGKKLHTMMGLPRLCRSNPKKRKEQTLNNKTKTSPRSSDPKTTDRSGSPQWHFKGTSSKPPGAVLRSSGVGVNLNQRVWPIVVPLHR